MVALGTASGSSIPHQSRHMEFSSCCKRDTVSSFLLDRNWAIPRQVADQREPAAHARHVARGLYQPARRGCMYDRCVTRSDMANGQARALAVVRVILSRNMCRLAHLAVWRHAMAIADLCCQFRFRDFYHRLRAVHPLCAEIIGPRGARSGVSGRVAPPRADQCFSCRLSQHDLGIPRHWEMEYGRGLGRDFAWKVEFEPEHHSRRIVENRRSSDRRASPTFRKAVLGGRFSPRLGTPAGAE